MHMAITFEEAKQIAYSAFQKDPTYGKTFIIDITRIQDKGIAWFFPFRYDQAYGGGGQGCFVGKADGDLMNTGSGLPISMYLTGFRLGLRYQVSNLIIKKVNKPAKALELLLTLHLCYFIPEQEAGETWKIQKPFTAEMILKKLDNLPCTFYNQEISGAIRQFRRIVRSNALEYEIKEVKYPPMGERGENLNANYK